MKYNIIYADPPWSYRQHSIRGAAERHYQTMSVEDIRLLDVPSLCADDCCLFLWVTWPTLLDAISVISAWGFTYKTVGFVWVKKNKKSPSWFFGPGFWTRANTEVCLLGIKGHPHRVSAAVSQLVVSPVGQHSSKPAEVRDRIVDLMGDVPRIELFARDVAPGWDTWGDECECHVNLIKRGGRNEKPQKTGDGGRNHNHD